MIKSIPNYILVINIFLFWINTIYLGSKIIPYANGSEYDSLAIVEQFILLSIYVFLLFFKKITKIIKLKDIIYILFIFGIVQLILSILYQFIVPFIFGYNVAGFNFMIMAQLLIYFGHHLKYFIINLLIFFLLGKYWESKRSVSP